MVFIFINLVFITWLNKIIEVHESLSSYFKIILFAIKNNLVIEFINLKWQKDTDRFRRKRNVEYSKKALSTNKVISKIFPWQNINQKILEEINLNIERFIEERKDKNDKIERRLKADEEDFKNFLNYDIKITDSSFWF